LPFSSEIEILNRKKNYVMFKKNKWIKKKDITLINKKEKNFVKIFKLYLNCKYKWGGKTYQGIDCSALVQLFYKFNNKFFPRDTVDQIKYKKGSITKKNFELGDIIYWKGHVAVCLNSNQLIHAYGPRKKVVIMPIKRTIDLIEKGAKLKVKKIFKI
jgi:cell wall-associated NlpC family hydrolase